MKLEVADGNGMMYFIARGDDGTEIGQTDFYTTADGDIVITHVGVSPPHRGRGNGEEFVACIARYAREKGVRVQPFCGFAREVFSRRSDLRDVLM